MPEKKPEEAEGMNGMNTTWRKTTLVVAVVLLAAGLVFGAGGTEQSAGAEEVTLWRTIDRFAPGERYAVVPYEKDFGVLEKKFNVKFAFTDVPRESQDEQLNIMVATNNLPDMVYSWSSMDKSFLDPALLYADELIYALDDFSKEIPDYLTLLETYPAIKKSVTNDAGNIICFREPNIYLESAFSGGPMIRKDWLDKLGLGIPDTYLDWLNAFDAFKNRDPNGNGKADEVPYVGSAGTLRVLANTLGTPDEFYMQGGPNGKVVYGPAMNDYKARLLFMRDVVQKGYINATYNNFSGADRDQMMANDIAGSTFTGIGNMDRWNLTQEAAGHPTFLMWAVAYPKGPDGARHFDRGMITKSANDATIMIAKTAGNPALVAAIANFFYTEEGILMNTFGVEGITYNMVNGFPIYSELIMKNKEGLTPFDARSKYVGIPGVPKPTDIRDVAQLSLTTPASRAAVMTIWTDVFDINNNQPIPPALMADEDAQEFADIMADLKTYVDTESAKFIQGQLSIENDFAKFQADVKKLNYERALALQQKAVSQWQARGGAYKYNMARADIDWSNLPMLSARGSELVDPSMISEVKK
jgi:putative aldouronate transport system substrate-binding protein